MSELLPAPARALEAIAARIRQAVDSLVSLDALDRWGVRDPDARAHVEAQIRTADQALAALRAELTRRSDALRAEDPGALEAWARAHQRLLDAFVASLPSDESARTARYVAQKERDEWDEVALGARPWVDRNTFYVQYDAALFAALFGSLEGSDGKDVG
ncbi:MAG: hypothetical protein KF729_34310 [Sandaracinaceae bacterium]|nr:hypothetical protein [Sandaracinaceae bacterium]